MGRKSQGFGTTPALKRGALELSPRLPAWCFQYLSIRARVVILRVFGAGGYYRNPVNWKGVKSRKFYFALELLKTAIYRIVEWIREC